MLSKTEINNFFILLIKLQKLYTLNNYKSKINKC